MKTKSDGSTASYYELPDGATELQHLISHRNMNSQIGEAFRACYRYGLVDHSDMLRDAKKIRFYAQAEIERLEKLEQQSAAIDSEFGHQNMWPEESRIDNIGANGNDGEHYAEAGKPDWKDAPEWAKWIAQDESGRWYWFEQKPKRSHICMTWFVLEGRFERWSESVDSKNPNWRNTLEARP